jgi:hypothetical protein
VKIRMTVLLLAALLIPGAALASNTTNKGAKESCNCHDKRNHHMMDKNWHEKMKLKEQKLLSLAAVYTPEKQKEWSKVISERNKLREKWLSPEYAEKREKWKIKNKARVEALQKELNSGKITKEEFMKKVHGEKMLNSWKTYNELMDAVKNNNKKSAAVRLNQLLIQYEKESEMMKTALLLQ